MDGGGPARRVYTLTPRGELHLERVPVSETSRLWPVLPDTIYNGIQVVQRGKIDTSFSQDRSLKTLTQTVVITSFDSGFYTISSIPFYYRVLPDTNTLVAETEMAYLKVNGIAVDTSKAIKPIKGIMKVPITFREILPWLLLGLAVLYLGTTGSMLLIPVLRQLDQRLPANAQVPTPQADP